MTELMEDLFQYIYHYGYFEGYEGDYWEGEYNSHYWDKSLWNLIKKELNLVEKYFFNKFEFRTYETDNWFRLEHINCDSVNINMFQNLRLDDKELFEICNRINKYFNRYYDDLDEFVYELGEGTFSSVIRISEKWVWKKYTEHDTKCFESCLYKDAEYLLGLDGISIFPSVGAYIQNKGVLIEYIDGKPFNLSEYKKYERNIIFNKLLEGFQEAYRRGYLYQDVKEENVLITADLNPVMIDVGYFNEVSSGIDHDEQWVFINTDVEIENEIYNIRKLYNL